MSKFNNIKFNDPDWFKKGINYIDCDAEWPVKYLPVGETQINMATCSEDLQKRYDAAETAKEKMLLQAEAYFEKISAGTTITDMAFCVFQQTSMVESSYADWFIRETAGKVERKEPMPEDLAVVASRRSGTIPNRRGFYLNLYRDLTENGLDWADIAIEKCAESGIRPWLYFRMNDMHHIDYTGSPWHDSFFFKAKENGWLIGNEAYGHPEGTSGNIKNLYNFACPEVREWYLNCIEETILRYDTFGFGLDFIRNIYCFDYLKDTGYQEHMNDFIRKIRGFITKAEEKFGHDIKLLVRIAHTPEDNYIYGYDVETWVKEGLVDVIVASCEEVCNSSVDVDEWKKLLGENTAFLIGLDDHIIRWKGPKARAIYHTTEAQVKGLTASYLNRGADGVYFNNYYMPMGGSIATLARHANREKASEGVRTLVVSGQDIAPKNRTATNPLPMPASGKDGRGAELSLNIGKVRAEEYVYLTVGYTGAETYNINVTLDGATPAASEEISVKDELLAGHYFDETRTLTDAEKLVRYRFENVSKDGAMGVRFACDDAGCNIVYLEISVNPEKLD